MPILALHGFTGSGIDFAPFAEILQGPENAASHPARNPCVKPVARNDVASGFTPRSDPDRKSTKPDYRDETARPKQARRDWLPDWHCPDLPGHGPDPRLDCSPEATTRFVNQAIQAMDTAQNASPRVLLGYSMGARAALLHAVNFPDCWDALVLISGNPGIEDSGARAERAKADESLAQSLERMGIASFLDFWQETPLIRSQKEIPTAWRETMLQNRQRHTVDGLAKSLRQFGQGSCPNLWPQVGNLAMPVCLITGAKDTKYTAIAARMSTLLPHSKSHHTVIHEASHMPHLERAEATSKIVKDFLQSL